MKYGHAVAKPAPRLRTAGGLMAPYWVKIFQMAGDRVEGASHIVWDGLGSSGARCFVVERFNVSMCLCLGDAQAKPEGA